MTIQEVHNIYMVGIKGVGMTALALILNKMGKNVWGSDVVEEFKTDAVLKRNGITILPGFTEQNISENIDLVITTAAHGGLSNPEVLAAQRKGISIMTHAEALGIVMNLFKLKISVCGSHGKTTVSAMIAFVFEKLKIKAGYHVGAASFSGYDAGGFSGYDYFVTEADEYLASPGINDTPRFMFQNPDIIICTNIDFDHPDVYKNLDAVEDAFVGFLQKLMTKNGTLIYYKNDVLLHKIAHQLSLQKIHAYDLIDAQNISLSIPGNHNQLNAAAAQTLFQILGFDEDQTKKALAEFKGSSRRFEKIYENFGFVLYDDYAHHPAEIVATIAAVRIRYPSRRLVVIFQPHTFSRTERLKEGFIKALAKADSAVIVDIFPSKRENVADYTITSQSLVKEAQNQGIKNITYYPVTSLNPELSTLLKPGDIIITMGAGSIYELHSDIIEMLKKL